MAETKRRRTARPAGVEIDGSELRLRRQLRGETLETFADRCGISVGYLSQLERGARPRVGVTNFGAICDALGLEDRSKLLPKPSRRRAA